MERIVRRRIIVSGHVQGVFFRDSCRRRAADLGVAGTVENRDDGTVEVVAQGEPEAVEQLVKWCRTGPPRAAVSGVDVGVEEPSALDGFRIVH